MSYYKIISILHTGIDGERDTPRTDGRYPLRVNRIVELNEKDIVVGKPFRFDYVTDQNGNYYRGFHKWTSFVKDWDFIFDDMIYIETFRSIYELERVEEA